MREFVAIDFETGNPKRVSACALGYAIVQNGAIIECDGFLMKPVGGHAPFQTKIHGLCAEHTADKPEFGDIYSSVSHLFEFPLVGHSMFDQQVLNALSKHFNLPIHFNYTDSVSIAKQKLPSLKNHKLKTVAKHFELPKFKHHDATDDARACANIFLRLLDIDETVVIESGGTEFELIAESILEDGKVDYKEVYQLKYWLEDHIAEAAEFGPLLSVVNQTLEDDILDDIEAQAIKSLLDLALHKRQTS
jgi:DNA polymerase-3 subunit epsilon